MNIFLGLGSNLGKRRSYLNTAHNELEWEGIKIMKSSPIYESPAMYMNNQPDFLNQVLEIETILGPLALLDVIKTIEIKLGRKQKSLRYSSREIDLDVLAMGQFMINSERLTIPHLNLANRKFVLKPWFDIAPDFKVPIHEKPVETLLAECLDHSEPIQIEELEYTF